MREALCMWALRHAEQRWIHIRTTHTVRGRAFWCSSASIYGFLVWLLLFSVLRNWESIWLLKLWELKKKPYETNRIKMELSYVAYVCVYSLYLRLCYSFIIVVVVAASFLFDDFFRFLSLHIFFGIYLTEKFVIWCRSWNCYLRFVFVFMPFYHFLALIEFLFWRLCTYLNTETPFRGKVESDTRITFTSGVISVMQNMCRESFPFESLGKRSVPMMCMCAGRMIFWKWVLNSHYRLKFYPSHYIHRKNRNNMISNGSLFRSHFLRNSCFYSIAAIIRVR